MKFTPEMINPSGYNLYWWDARAWKLMHQRCTDHTNITRCSYKTIWIHSLHIFRKYFRTKHQEKCLHKKLENYEKNQTHIAKSVQWELCKEQFVLKKERLMQIGEINNIVLIFIFYYFLILTITCCTPVNRLLPATVRKLSVTEPTKIKIGSRTLRAQRPRSSILFRYFPGKTVDYSRHP